MKSFWWKYINCIELFFVELNYSPLYICTFSVLESLIESMTTKSLSWYEIYYLFDLWVILNAWIWVLKVSSFILMWLTWFMTWWEGKKFPYLQVVILLIERDTCVLKKGWPTHDNVFQKNYFVYACMWLERMFSWTFWIVGDGHLNDLFYKNSYDLWHDT